MFKKPELQMFFALIIMLVLFMGIPLSVQAKTSVIAREDVGTPTATWVPSCTMVDGITTSDLAYQTPLTYGCLDGCASSPYLKQAASSFLAGDYYWTVEIVGGPSGGTLVNNGHFL